MTAEDLEATRTAPRHASGLRFRLLNRIVNPIVGAVLRSPLHALLSGRVALITVTGHGSGREFTIPVGYRAERGTILIQVGWPEQKVWWRNIGRDPTTVRVLVRGSEHVGQAVLRGDERSGVRIEVGLDSSPTE